VSDLLYARNDHPQRQKAFRRHQALDQNMANTSKQTNPVGGSTSETIMEKKGSLNASHVEDALEEEAEENFRWDLDVVTNLLALYSIYFASTWAMSVPSSSIAFIMYEFPSDHSTTSWIAGTPSLALAVISIFLGDISDIFGRKWFLVVAAASGLIGMLIGGRATNIPMLIGAQVFNGIGLTLGFLSTPLLAEVVPKRYRAPIVGGGTLLAALAGVAGQIIQGACMKHNVGGVNKGWRMGFYLGAVFFFLALVSLLLLYRPGKRPNPEGYSTRTQLLKIDWLGIFLGTAGLLLLMLGLQSGGGTYPWKSGKVLGFLISGGLTFAVFILWEWKGVQEGLFPKSLFEHRNYSTSLALNFVEGMVIFSSQAFMPQMILSLLTSDMILAAVYNLPNAAGSLIGVLGTAWIAAKTKEAKWLAVGGVACLLVGGSLMALMQPHINFAAWFFPSILIGTGIGTLGVIIPVISTLCTPNRYIATSVAVGTSVRGVGGALGIVIFTQIFSSKVREILPTAVGRAVIMAGLPPSSMRDLMLASASHDAAAMQRIPGVSPAVLSAMEHATAQAYADAFRFIWYALIPFSVVTLAASLALKSTKEQMTLQVASRVQKHFVTSDESDKEHAKAVSDDL
jgi:MFS family permease